MKFMEQKLSINVRFAEKGDLNFCVRHDYKHLNEAIIKKKIEEEAVIIAEVNKQPVGYLRISYMWLIIPYLDIICVDEKFRKKAIGIKMIEFLQKYLRREGHRVLYSSSQANEPDPQAWHRRIGFEECGYIVGINHPDGNFSANSETEYTGKAGIGEIFFRKIL